MAILIFVLVLFVLVLVHELGHFLTAKKTGMRVDEFGIGFPPKLWSFKRGETEYSLNALPLGGFVRIYGEDGDAQEGAGALCAPAPRHDHDRFFSGKSKWAQSLVLLAGIAMNILFAWLLFTIALSHGILTNVSPEEATDAAELYILDVLPESPAHAAHIPAGAMVTRLRSSGKTILPRTPDEFRFFVQESGGAPVTVEYVYNDIKISVEAVPAEGVLDESKDTRAIGVSLGLAEIQSLPLHTAITEGFMMTARGIRDIVGGLFMLIGSAFVLQANLAEVAGPIGIVGLVGDASALGLSTLLMFTAFISLNLAVINILPFPALDGGRLLFVIIEAIKGSPIKAQIAYYTNTIGFAILILLMVAITYNDIAKLV
jgi:regulator of sigma E protease